MKRKGDFFKQPNINTARACAYFPERVAQVEEVFLWKEHLSPEQTDEYLAQGWRHMSWYFYRNSCPDCRRCLPIRVETNVFKPVKSQRRILKKNSETEFKIFEPVDFATRYITQGLEIYNKFLHIRYGKPARDLGEYISEFFISPVTTIVSALFINGELIANGFLDLGKTSLSTIYFCFDPHFGDFSPGTFSILKEIEWAQKIGLRYYYLGYRIRALTSMNYKGTFRPHQILDFDTGVWKYPDSHDDKQGGHEGPI